MLSLLFTSRSLYIRCKDRKKCFKSLKVGGNWSQFNGPPSTVKNQHLKHLLKTGNFLWVWQVLRSNQWVALQVFDDFETRKRRWTLTSEIKIQDTVGIWNPTIWNPETFVLVLSQCKTTSAYEDPRLSGNNCTNYSFDPRSIH